MASAKFSAFPRVWVACLAAYNNGFLHGAWIDADQEPDTLQTEIDRILKTSPIPDAEEWAIHDYDEFYEAASILGEHPSLATLHEAACLIAEHGELAAKLIARYGKVAEAVRAMDERYQGIHRSVADYAETYIEDTGQLDCVPEPLRWYFDYERLARDWQWGSDIFTIEVGLCKVAVFTSY